MIKIGDQWCHLKFERLHFVAMWRLKYPTKVDGANGNGDYNGDSGNIGANGDNNDPWETLMIHWSFNCANRDNNVNRDNDANGYNHANRDSGTNSDNDADEENGSNCNNGNIVLKLWWHNGNIGTKCVLAFKGFIGSYGFIGTSGGIRSIAIGANESPLAPFLSQMAPMTRIPNRYDPFTHSLFTSLSNDGEICCL